MKHNMKPRFSKLTSVALNHNSWPCAHDQTQLSPPSPLIKLILQKNLQLVTSAWDDTGCKLKSESLLIRGRGVGGKSNQCQSRLWRPLPDLRIVTMSLLIHHLCHTFCITSLTPQNHNWIRQACFKMTYCTPQTRSSKMNVAPWLR